MLRFESLQNIDMEKVYIFGDVLILIWSLVLWLIL